MARFKPGDKITYDGKFFLTVEKVTATDYKLKGANAHYMPIKLVDTRWEKAPNVYEGEIEE